MIAIHPSAPHFLSSLSKSNCNEKYSIFICVIVVLFVLSRAALNPDQVVTTEHTVTVKGNKIPYKAIAGTLPVYGDSGKIIAGVFFTYYERTDIKDRSTRPLIISFNGGPGTSSVWMEMGYTGPRLVNVDVEGYPVQPYGIKENPYSLVVGDIVYVDPVNTGYSRITGNAPPSKFFGVNADIKYLAEWLSTFVTRYSRWTSPKYLIGESYGTNRVSGLALELQNRQWMFLNGVVLVSPTILGIERTGPVDMASRLPYYAATAWIKCCRRICKAKILLMYYLKWKSSRSMN